VNLVTDPAAVFHSEITNKDCAAAGTQIVLTILGLGNASDAFQVELHNRIGDWESWDDSHNGGWGPAAVRLALAAYGAPGYGQPTYAAPQSMSGNTITLLVISGLTTIGCGFGIFALIFAIIAAAKKDQPAESAKYTKWGWIALGVTLALLIVAVVAVVALASTSGSSNFDSGY
jgi:hypothetical protein